ncbi:MAG: S1/P1 nuclease [Dysgonamonadaceae bacterium]|jgi:hypothetical protein|nr:S1/P1 nuclease [Dysgonamonadaceae bacterium]
MLKYILAITLIVFKTFQAFGWGSTGHRIIGEIAENQLTATAKERINTILGNASIAMVANWGDEIRSDPAYDFTRDWHYTNLDTALSRPAFNAMAVRLDNGQNIYSVITLTEYLKQIPDDTAMLKMLIHLVGDMHCPLHLGHAGDRGGNTIEIIWFHIPANLHSLWDSALIDSQKLSYTEYSNHLMRIYPTESVAFDGTPDTILGWAWNIYLQAQTVYGSADETGKSYEYLYKYKPLWEKCLVDAAAHLAALLNYIYN